MSDPVLFSCDPQDERNHYPESNDNEQWQESWCLAWYDPLTRVGGFHHTGMSRNRGIADAWSWIARRGEIIQKYQNNSLPAVEDDFWTGVRLGPIELTTLEPLRRRRIVVSDGTVRAELQFRVLTDTFKFSADVRASHWEHTGLVEGTVTVSGETTQVRAFAFQDRSWGPRNWATKITYRWAWGCFGDDLLFSLFNITDPEILPDGHLEKGYIIERGRQFRVVKVDVTVEMSADGVNPSGAALVAWTDGGARYRFRGQCDGASAHTHRDGFMMSDACTNWTFGDRLGSGFIEVNELKMPTMAMRRELGLDPIDIPRNAQG
jgi:hypothetical protein